jgi:hypothetical protein
MELIASDNNVPPQEINIPIRELLRLGYRESEVVEFTQLKYLTQESNNKGGQTQE